jgi:hypothetical protein
MEEIVLPEVPGIVEASMTICPEADGRISFRVMIGADGGQSSECDLIELIISPEDISRGLAGANIGTSQGAQIADGQPIFPCHIGLNRNARAADAQPGSARLGPG